MRLLTAVLGLIVGVMVAATAIFTLATGSTGQARVTGMMLLAIAIPMVLFSIVKLIRGPAIERLSRNDSPDKTLTFSRTESERLALIVCTVSIAVAAYLFMQLHPERAKVRIFGSVTVVMGVVAAIGLALRGQSQLILSPAGLEHSLFKIGAIAWSDIMDVRRKRLYRSDMIQVAIRNHSRYFAPGHSRKLDLRRDQAGNIVAVLSIMPQTVGAPTKPILAAIELRLATFSKNATSLTSALERQA